MNYIKRRISLLLCFLLVFTTAFIAVPQEVQAATTYSIHQTIGSTNSDICICTNAVNVYAGDFFTATASTSVENYEYLGYLSQLKNVTYKSSKTSVAKIDSKTGKITPKKTGTTTITVKYKNQTVSFKLNVVTSKTFYKNLNTPYTNYKDLAATYEKEAKAFLKEAGSDLNITTKNRYKFLTAYNNQEKYFYGGYTYYSAYNESTGSYERSLYLYSPSTIHACAIYESIGNYAGKLNPFTTYSAKYFKINAISGKGKTITITLKDKVTADQIFGANSEFSWDTEVKESNTYTFPITIKRSSNNLKYYGIATIKKGSNKMTIQLQSASLVKGQTYQLLAKTPHSKYTLGDWLNTGINKNTFKAK